MSSVQIVNSESLVYEPVNQKQCADAPIGFHKSLLRTGGHPVPNDGTHFNFCESGGLGCFVPIVPSHVFLKSGMRFEHISNAGVSRNPGY